MKKIDLNTWARREHFEFFMGLDMPQYQMTFELDVTPLVSYTKAHKESFYFHMMHVVMQAVHDIENFRYRIINKEVYLFDQIDPSFTDLIKGSDLFKFVTASYERDKHLFVLNAKKTSQAQDFFVDHQKESRSDVVYITTFPWASYLHGTHAMNQDKYDAIPRFSWGKFELKDDRYKMPFTLMVHHGFIDGFHVHLYLEKLSEYIDKYLKM